MIYRTKDQPLTVGIAYSYIPRTRLLALCLTAVVAISGCGNSPSTSTENRTPDSIDDPANISVDNASASEGDPGDSSQLTFTLTLSTALESSATIDYATADGSAIAGSDYTAQSGTVTFAAGVQTQTVTVALISDNDQEQNETFALLLSNPQNATSDNNATGTILDDDSARQLSIDDAAGGETDGQLSFQVNLDVASGSPVTFDFATSNAEATAGNDYTANSGQLTIPAGSTTAQIDVGLINDSDEETTETFNLTLSNASGADINRAVGVGTIADDDMAAEVDSLDAELIDDAPTANRCDFIDPNYCLFPWPNDHFTVADSSTATGRRINLDSASMPINSAGKPLLPTEWNRNDGFALTQLILARVENVDLAATGAPLLTSIHKSLQPDSPIFLLNATTGERHLAFAEIDVNQTKFGPCDGFSPAASAAGLADFDDLADGANEIQDNCDGQGDSAPDEPGVDPGPALMIRPMVNLTEGHRYIVALRNLKDADGNNITAAPEFRVCRDSAPTQIPQVQSRCDALEPVFTELTAHGVNRSELNLAWDFTAISRDNMVERMIHIRDDALLNDLSDATPSNGIVDGDSPAFTITSVVNFTPAQNDKIARRIRGRFPVPCYLDSPNCAPGGKFFYLPGAEGPFGDNLPDQSSPASVLQAAFVCNIPRVAFNDVDDATAATGVSLVRPALYGHGLLGSRNESGNGGGGHLAEMAQFQEMMFCATDWYGMATGVIEPNREGYDPLVDNPPGGDIANVASVLVDMSNFGTLVDRVQQGMLAFIYLGRAMIHPDGFAANAAFQDAAGSPVIDTAELFYDGNSQGGIIGAPLVAVSPDIRAAALGVPGQSYSMLLRRSVDFDPYGGFFYSSYRSSLDQSFVLSLIQMLWDRSEASGYMHYLRAGNGLDAGVPKRILLHPAFGDHQVTMWTAEQMARTAEAPVHCPGVVTGSSPAGEQITPAVLSGVHPDVEAEADKFNAESPTGITHARRRHPDDIPYFDIPCIDYGSNGHNGNALVVWDTGPHTDARAEGAVSPPTDNSPPRPESGYGGDPHSDPRKTRAAQNQKGNFLRQLNPSTGDGLIINVCGDAPCASDESDFDPTP